MPTLPEIGKTKHKHLVTDARLANDRMRANVADAVAELKRIATRPGPPRLDRIAVLLADMARTIAAQQTDLDEMRDLITQAQPADDVANHLADLQHQIDRLREQMEAHHGYDRQQ